MKPHYKQTEVGIIPEDWDVFKFGDIVTIRNLKVVAASTSTGTQCVELESMGQGTGRLLMSYETRGMSAKYSFRKGDVLFGRLRAYLRKFWHATFDGICSTEIWPLIPRNERLSGNFLHLLVQTNDFVNTAGVSYGTHMPRSDWSVLKEFPVRLPRIAEQCSIAEVLFHVDALIGALDRLIAKKRDLKQATMQQLLTGQTRLPGFSGEWEVKKLGQLARIQRGASPRPIDSPVWFDENSSVGWVRISDVTKSGMHLFETTQRLSTLGIQNSRPVERGNLIMSICATVGRPIITGIDTCIHDGFVVFDDLQAARQFIYYVLKSIEGNWSRHGQTGSQMNLNTELIKRTEILLPPTTDEQTAIATVLSDMDAEIAALEARSDKTRLLKQGMMQELLTGKTRLI